MKSEKPEAKAFKNGLTFEVFPAIRKAGKYSCQSPVERQRQIYTAGKSFKLALQGGRLYEKVFPTRLVGHRVGRRPNNKPQEKRRMEKGVYQRGMPDLIVYNKHAK